MMTAELLVPSAKLIGLRVLLVDDNPICSAVLSERLGDWGMAVVDADGGATALQQLETLEAEGRLPGAVILSEPTQNKDGVDLARAITTDSRYAGMPIVLVGPSPGVTPLDMESAGVAAWLPADLAEAKLRETLLRVMGPAVRQPKRPTHPTHPAAVAVDPDALDHSVIERLRALDSPARPGFLNKLIDRYIHSTGGHMAEMRDALSMGDAERLRVSAHSFKGSSLNLGAHRLAKVCEELEARGREKKLNVTTEGLLARAAYELVQATAALRAVQQAR